jgi:NADH-quinone oxidoreductase subunit M
VLFLIITLSSIALPGTNGFVGEFLILLGAFRNSVPFGVIATSGVVLGAVYMLWMFQRVMYGEITKEENRKLKDINARETTILVLIVFFVFFMGLYSQPFFKKMDVSATNYLQYIHAKADAQAASAKVQ